MTELFTSINFEVYNGGWVDITADVKHEPRPRWNRGIMSNKTWDRVGHPGILTFTLDNSASNSAGLSGYYSPGHTNCWAGWTSGLKVRLSFTYGGTTYYKYYGRIKPNGIRVEALIYGGRTVDITCGDWMWTAGQHELKNMAYATSQTIGAVVNAVNNSMPIYPLDTSISVGVETFPTTFDMTTSKTTALAEYQKAAMSEWGYIYMKGDAGGYGSECLTDGGVENWTSSTTLTDWTKSGTSLARESTSKYAGSYSAKLTTFGDYCVQSISHLKAGVQYKITGWISCFGDAGGLFRLYSTGYSAVRFTHLISPGITSYWEETYTAVGDETLPLFGNEYGAGTVYFDSFSIKPIKCGEVLVVESQAVRTSSIPSQVTFNNVMSDMDVGYGRTQVNRVNSTAYPRRVDGTATTVLWSLQKSFQILSGETITDYRGQYRDPSNPATKVSGISMAAMVSGTDYTATANEDGTGGTLTANLTVTPTFGSEAVTFTLSATADLWVQVLQVKGKGVYTDTPIQSVSEDTDSQKVHGVIPISLDFKYLSDAGKARNFSGFIISAEAWPRKTVDSCSMWVNKTYTMIYWFLNGDSGDKITVVENQSGINSDCFINGYSAEIYDMKYVLWSPVLAEGPGYYTFGRWDSGKWDTALWGL